MKKIYFLLNAAIVILLSSCNNNPAQPAATEKPEPKMQYGGYATQVEWGKHIIISNACGECHTPKKMTEKGPEPIDSLFLAGYWPNASVPDFHRAELEKKGMLAANEQISAFAGPWGISFAANLTSDPTGIGNWEVSNFVTAMRHGKYMGMESSRDILPPMPWQFFANLSDEELKAMFAFLKTTKPIHNIVPAPVPPTTAPGGGKKK